MIRHTVAVVAWLLAVSMTAAWVWVIVDHRFDRARYDGERTAAAFAERLRGEVDLATLETDVIRTVGAALRPTASGLWLRSSSRDISRPTSP
jgi:hypothetical protein